MPELVSSIIATKKGETELALGNILGSNLFNSMAVVGVAGLIRPLSVSVGILNLDLPVMLFVTIILFLLGYGFKREGRINQFEGAFLLLVYISYTVYLIRNA